jgi:hypothetical protein
VDGYAAGTSLRLPDQRGSARGRARIVACLFPIVWQGDRWNGMGNGVVLWRVLHRAQRRPKAFYKVFLRGADNGPHPPPSRHHSIWLNRCAGSLRSHRSFRQPRPPRFIRHWRRSAPEPLKGKARRGGFRLRLSPQGRQGVSVSSWLPL